MNDDVAAKLKAIVGPKGFTDDPAQIAPYLDDWKGSFHGRSPLLLKPSSTDQVSSILAFCHATKTAVVPQGGNTGLVGGQIPYNNEVLISLSRLNAIRSVDIQGSTIIAEAGVILATAQQAAKEAGLLLPLSMASEGSCTIGGAISTNAGGINVLRYGMARQQVLGLEVVQADGQVLDLLRTLRKDNTGYDLKQLFIGGEGTLGIVTAAALRLLPQPACYATAFLAVDDLRVAPQILSRLQSATGNAVEAFEAISARGMDLLVQHVHGSRRPLETKAPWYLLCEVSGPACIAEMVPELLDAALTDGLVLDAVIAVNETQRRAFWKLREDLSEAEKKEGPSFKHDASVPLEAVAEFVDRATAALAAAAPGLRPLLFGHLGDGNIHYNVHAASASDNFPLRAEEIARIIHDVAHEFGGSFSAEHGIGVLRRAEFHFYRSEAERRFMQTLKRAIDPNNILNPGKLVPE